MRINGDQSVWRVKTAIAMTNTVITTLVVTWLLACSGDSDYAVVPPQPPPPPPGSGVGDINVNPAIRYQTIVGWEATAQSGEQDVAAFDMYADSLFELAVNDLGITRIRLEAWSGMENTRDWWSDYRAKRIDDDAWKANRYCTINDNADPNSANTTGFFFSQLDYTVEKVVLPLKAKIEARGERLYINLNYVSFYRGCSSSDYVHAAPEEYAEFALAVMEHLRTRYNLIPDGWEMILEPDNSDWRGTTIGQALAATGARLSAAGFTPDFIAPSNTNMQSAIQYFDDMIVVPGVRQYLKEFSYHRYSGVSAGNLQAIATRATQYGVRTAMLEHITSGHNDLHDDLKVARNSAWQEFALAYPGTGDDGGIYYAVDTANPGRPLVRITPRAKFLRQYFRFIRPGAQRIEATTSKADFDPVAFINTNGRYVVVVKADDDGAFTVGGLPAGRYGITYTTSAQYDVSLPDVTLAAGQNLAAIMPAAGAITIYGK